MWKSIFVLRMLELIKLVLFLHSLCEAHLGQCQVSDPPAPLHMYHQSGELLIGGIASQAFIVTDAITFTHLPPAALSDELM